MFLGLGLTIHGQGSAQGGGVDPLAWMLSAAGVRPKLDIDFLRNEAYASGAETTPATAVACTRSSTAYYMDRAGLLTSVAINTLRTGDMGMLLEDARTNVALHNRDLTNVAWVKVNCTAAKNQTGPDGVVNSASSLTATVGNATCLQSIVLASSTRSQSAFVKRLTGSGVIEMTTDAGLTWVAIFPRTNWEQLYLPPQTLANPTVGFRIVTSGDAIAVDFVQNEDGSCPTSPIATTTVAVTRGADAITFSDPSSYLNATGMTFHFAGARSGAAGVATAFSAQKGATSEVMFLRVGANTVFRGVDGVGATQWDINADFPNGSAKRSRRVHIGAIAPNDIAYTDEGGAVSTDGAAALTGYTNAFLGTQMTVLLWNGYIHRFAAWDSRVSDTNLVSVSRQKADFVLIGEGDSIPLSPTTTDFLGFFGRTEFISDYKRILSNRASPSSTVVNGTDALSLSGTRLTALNALRVSFVAENLGKEVITLVHIGRNDLQNNGYDAAAFTSQLATYLDSLHAAGHLIIGCTVLPSTVNAAFNPARATANTTIRAFLGTRIDYLCDWDLTAMGVDAAASDTTLYSDGTHPTALGAIIMAEFLKTIVDGIAA